MAIRYESIVPWGRSFDEYRRMFSLSDSDCRTKIIGCGDGPASFNAEMNARGHRVVSIDPLYIMSRERIKTRIDETFKNVMTQTANHHDKFRWINFRTLDELAASRMASMNRFLEDFDGGKRDGRYVAAQLPSLPFVAGSFDLILSAHLLFFYSDNLSLEFHIASVREMMRVGKEVRIFPLVDVNAKKSGMIQPVVDYCQSSGWHAEVHRVDYEFQVGGNEMLRLLPASRA